MDYCVHIGNCQAPDEEESPPQPPDQVDAGQGREGVYDPQAPDIWFDFPPGAVSVPVEVRAYRTELPVDVPLPVGGTIGDPFYFGAWIRGEGRTVPGFHRPIVIHARYGERRLAQASGMGPPADSMPLDVLTSLPLVVVAHPAIAILFPKASSPSGDSSLSRVDEEGLELHMYLPEAGAWVKLCSRVDPYANIVSAALLWPTPLEEGGNALFAIVSDDAPTVEQTVDDRGNTTLYIPDNNFRLGVLAGTVDVGSHFVITLLPEVPESDVFKLLPTPVDVKACYASDTSVTQVTGIRKPMNLAFDIDTDTLSRAGGWTNLTILGLQDRQWGDLEGLDYTVVRSDTSLSVDVVDLGTFGVAVR